MASITMIASFLGGATLSGQSSPISARQRLVVANNAAKTVEGENVKMNFDTKKESNTNTNTNTNNGRRDLMFAAAAAAVCSVAGIAVAEEPKRGTPAAKKAYAPVCVTMPTARICRN